MSHHSVTFDLAVRIRLDGTWHARLPAVEAALADSERVAWARLDAGWAASEDGWTAPDGSHESNWGEAGYPFPEDVAAYVEWHDTFYYYETLDNDLEPAALNPYPNAPTHRQHRYLPRQLPEQPEGQLFTNPPFKSQSDKLS